MVHNRHTIFCILIDLLIHDIVAEHSQMCRFAYYANGLMSNSNYKEFGSLLALAIVMFGVIGLVILLLRLDNIILSPLELLLILFVPTVVFLILASIILKRKK